MNRSNRRRGGPLRTLFITAAVIGVAALILLGGFRLRSVEVVGNAIHSANTITDDLIYDFWTRNSLFLAGKYRTAGYEARAPYLSSVQVKLTSPGAVTVTVTEKRIIGYVQYNSSIVSFDSEGLVLDISDRIYDGAILVDGITMEEPVLYQRLSLNNTALLRTMLNITKLTRDAELNPDRISFDDNQNITLTFGSVQVELGQDEYLEEKIANLDAIYPQISGRAGKLNMSAFTGKNETITFTEGEETEAVTESDAEAWDEEDLYGEDGTGENSGGYSEDGGDSLQIDVTDDGQSQADDQSGADGQEADEGVDTSNDTTTGVMVFDSSGTLRYDAHISGGVVVDASGNPIDGCSVTEEGYIKDAYWNIINPADGTLMNG